MTQTSKGRIRLLVQESRSSDPKTAAAAKAELDRLTVQFHTLRNSNAESR
jgi:hypothetical protein